MHRMVQRTSLPALAALLGALALGGPATATAAPTVQRLGDLPFPNDVFTVADPHTPTGRRVHFVQAAMPANAHGVHIDPHAWNWSDGFSPGSTIVVRIPGLDNAAAFRRSKLVPITDMAHGFDRDQAVVVIDAKTGARQPIWTEVDAQAARDAGPQPADPPGAQLPGGPPLHRRPAPPRRPPRPADRPGPPPREPTAIRPRCARP